jgi:small subunit ribosomal protein S7
MSRRGAIPKREINPDPKYGDRLVRKFMNVVMTKGKMSVAERIVYGAFDEIEKKRNEDPVKIFKAALENIKPSVEVRSRRVGGANYQVPVEVRADRRTALAFRWLRDYARERNDHTMKDRLAAEILDAERGHGGACKKRDDTHRMAEANKAFAHFRW